MEIDILTLFPDMFTGPFDASIIKRAESKDLIKVRVHDLRKWGEGERHNVDDKPYGGGVGMLLRVDIVDNALKDLRTKSSKVILLDATGKRFVQQKAVELSKHNHLILIAGHYEGIDHRVHENLVDEVISIGDYVLTGGELPSMVMTDAISRQIDGVLGSDDSIEEKRLASGAVYTRPDTLKYAGKSHKVPKVLKNGNHKEIDKWRLDH